MESDAPTATGTTNAQMCTLMSSDGLSTVHLGPGYSPTLTSSRFPAHLLKNQKQKRTDSRKTVV